MSDLQFERIEIESPRDVLPLYARAVDESWPASRRALRKNTAHIVKHAQSVFRKADGSVSPVRWVEIPLVHGSVLKGSVDIRPLDGWEPMEIVTARQHALTPVAVYDRTVQCPAEGLHTLVTDEHDGQILHLASFVLPPTLLIEYPQDNQKDADVPSGLCAQAAELIARAKYL